MYHLPKDRRKDDLIVYYIDKLLKDRVVNIRFATLDMIRRIYTTGECNLKLYDLIEECCDSEIETDVQQAMEDLLNVVL